MFELKMHKAKLINSNDPDKKGRVQIRVLPFMNEVKEEDLPWYDTLFSSNSSETKFEPPKEGSIVIVLPVNNTYRRGYCLFPDSIEGFFDFDSVKSSLDSIDGLSDTSYENIRFYLMENGNINFYNRSSGEHGVYHNSGSYTLFDTNGNIKLTSSSNIILQEGSDFAVRFSSLKSLIEELQNDITTLKNIFSAWVPISGDGGAALRTAALTWYNTPLIENIDDSKIDDINVP